MFDYDSLSDIPAADRAASDIRLVNARRLRWDKDAWQDQGFIALVISALDKLISDETECPVSRAEARMLVKKLYAIKRPSL
jgi:hypothetical protein